MAESKHMCTKLKQIFSAAESKKIYFLHRPYENIFLLPWGDDSLLDWSQKSNHGQQFTFYKNC